ncbi:hypothetical protein BJ742DRAFT_30746 [Cladochytrium replicatum]|nr:hypothetical protein BJ742DRAFT_30746 [Cladochytrium replicatum]
MKLVEMDRLESLGGFRVILVDEDCQRIGFNIRSPAKEKEQLVAPLTELLGECVALSNVKVVSCSRGRPDVCPLSEPEASDVILETMGTTFVNVAREELIPQTALRNPPPTSIPTIVEFPSISSFLNDKSHHPIAKIQAVITHVHVPSLEWTLSPTLPLETQINAFLLHHATHLSTFAFIYCKGCNERCDPDRNGIRSCPNRAECSRAGKLKLVPTFDKIVLGLSDPILSEEQGNVEMNTVERAFFQSSHGLWDASLRESLGAAAGQSSPRLMGGNAGVMEISVGYRVVEAFLALDGVVSVTPGEVLALSENGNEVASVCGRLVTVFWKACRFGTELLSPSLRISVSISFEKSCETM